ncbi:MAG: hypothetical protein HY897_03995 [Deltaproteobacteria bacterium]|nr:hypothetical protein [Deltaproteobacteria bacterium]
MKNITERISSFSLDHESGSSELAVQAIEILDSVAGRYDEEHDALAAVRTASLVFLAQPSIVSVLSTVNRFCLFAEEAGRAAAPLQKAWRDWAAGRERRIEQAVAYGVKAVEQAAAGPRTVTFSYSSLVIRVLVERAKAGVPTTVYVGESRPLFEGRKTALKLSAAGIAVTLCIDAALFEHLHKADLVLIGADGVYGGRVLSKIGTAPLIMLAAEHGVKVAIIASEEKIVPKGLETFLLFPHHDRAEIFPDAPAGLLVENRYLDMTDMRLVDWLSTETGAYCGADVRGDIHRLPVSEALVEVLEKQEG